MGLAGEVREPGLENLQENPDLHLPHTSSSAPCPHIHPSHWLAESKHLR